MESSVSQLHNSAVAQYEAIAAKRVNAQPRSIFQLAVYSIIHFYPATDEQALQFYRINLDSV